MKNPENILVIKLGALGDFIQALGPMAAIRRHHPAARITLLTTKPFAVFGQDCGYFDAVWIDQKPRVLDARGWCDLAKQLRRGAFHRVYDLQNNDRTRWYFKIVSWGGAPEWVGVVRGASHRNSSPERIKGRAFDGHVQTLELAGITGITRDTLEWMQADCSTLGLQPPFVLLVPGSSPAHLQKRWPAAQYGVLAHRLSTKGFQPVVLGAQAEQDLAHEIVTLCPSARDLTGRTVFAHIATLARGAVGAVGNDTGPMHLISATGCPSLTLFSGHSNPARHAPEGPCVQVLQSEMLEDLSVEDVFKGLEDILRPLPAL